MDSETVVKIVRIGGVIGVFAGLLLIVTYGTLPYVGGIYTVIGVLLIIWSLVFLWRVNKVAKKANYLKRRQSR